MFRPSPIWKGTLVSRQRKTGETDGILPLCALQQSHTAGTGLGPRGSAREPRARLRSCRFGDGDSMPRDIRTALVTGGARRIGAAIVRDLGRSRLGGRDPLQSVAGGGGRSSPGELSAPAAFAPQSSAADLADPAALRAHRPGQAAAALGPLTLLVNNASVFLKDQFGALDLGLWQTPIRRQPARAGLPGRGLRRAAARGSARATSST